MQDAVGYYKGRSYAEKMLVAYTDADITDDFVRIARILQQECYAYERDGELLSPSDACAFNGLRFYAASVEGIAVAGSSTKLCKYAIIIYYDLDLEVQKTMARFAVKTLEFDKVKNMLASKAATF